MRSAVVFEAERTGYAIEQIANGAMTVGELRGILEDFSDDDLVVMSHDNGYTFGSLSSSLMQESYEDEDGEWSETNFSIW